MKLTIAILLLIQLKCALAFGYFELEATLLLQNLWGWTDTTTGLYIACIMFALLLVGLCLSTGRFLDRNCVLAGLLCTIVGTAFLFSYKLPKFVSIIFFTIGSFVA